MSKSNSVNFRRRKASRKPAKVHYGSVKIAIPLDPPPVTGTIKGEQWFRVAVTVVPGTDFVVLPSTLYAGLPESVSTFRVDRFRIYGGVISYFPEGAGAPISLPRGIKVKVYTDNAIFEDVGAPGASRAGVGFIPGEGQRLLWHEPGGTIPFCTLISNAFPGAVNETSWQIDFLCQYVCVGVGNDPTKFLPLRTPYVPNELAYGGPPLSS